MTLNVFILGDLTFKQLNGTAMGTPPVSPYASMYYGIHKEKLIPQHTQHLIYCHWFIDDVIGIWCPNINPQPDALQWDSFKNKMNEFRGLTWEYSELSTSVDFMDMTITINKSNQVETTLFKKKLNLHLYIPPHSAHPPELLPGITYSTLF